ncbi:hypothetical protein PTKIN_Ptkin07bG0055400 [Pterospermum kingtungense]
MWHGKSTYYNVLKVFGCLAYAYKKQDKLAPKVVKCTSLGIVNGYKLWSLEATRKKCFYNMDFVFDESKMGNPSKYNVKDGLDNFQKSTQFEVE